MHKGHLCGESCPPLFRVEYLHKSTGTCLHGLFVSSFPFIKLFNYVFVLVWAPEYLLCSLNYNPRILYFNAKIVPLGHWEFCQLALVPLWQSLINVEDSVCFWAFPYFLVLQNAPGPYFIFFALVVEPFISLRRSSLFYWRMERSEC